MYRFILNGTEIDDHPDGWRDYSTESTFDSTLKLYHLKRDVNLTFYGQGWEILRDTFINSYCEEVTFVVYKENNILLDGYIKISDIEWNLLKNTCTVSPIDGVYYRYIDNNKNIPISLSTSNAKTGTIQNPIAITPPSQILIDISLTTEGGSPTTIYQRYIYDLKDVMDHIISFISDGTLTFESEWYDNLEDSEKIGVTNGALLRNGVNTPTVKLLELLDTVCKLENLYLLVDEINGVVRLENDEYIVGQSEIIDVPDIMEITYSIDQTKMYSGVRVGNQNSSTQTGLYGRFPLYNFLSFRPEEYYFVTNCNIDSLLDLTYKYNVDHNTIYEIVEDNDNSKDDDIILINYNSTTNVAVYSDAAGTGTGYVLNARWLNSSYINRHTLYNNVALTIDTTSNHFLAVTNSIFDSTSYTPGTSLITLELKPDSATAAYRLQFDDFTNGFDTSNNFGNYDTLLLTADPTTQGVQVPAENSVYIIPADGIYTFNLSATIKANKDFSYLLDPFEFYGYPNNPGSGTWATPRFTFYVFIQRYDSSYSLLQNYGYSIGWSSIYFQNYGDVLVYGTNNDPASIRLTIEETHTFNAVNGDIITYYIQWIKNDAFYANFQIESLVFKTLQAETSGGEVYTTGNNQQQLGVVNFTAPITEDEVMTILEQPYTRFSFSDGTYSGFGKIKNVKINHTTNMVDFTLETSTDLLST